MDPVLKAVVIVIGMALGFFTVSILILALTHSG